ncbi:MAG: hypothetical protein ACQGVC_19285 [Myxococcota bacterium]
MTRERGTPDEAFRPMTIVVQDPGFRDPETHQIVTAQVDVPAERLARGPWGYRIQVVDYDVTTSEYHPPHDYGNDLTPPDPFDSSRGLGIERILNDRQFHQQNVYAIAMRTLARFEMALGRRVDWAFTGHQLKIAPHAFSGANAFYSRDDNGLMFGYFQGRENTIYSCLSHDVVAHETTHAVLDGLRRRYMDASSDDQAGFHEGFADVVALLSIFSIPEVASTIMRPQASRGRLTRDQLREDALLESALFKMADEMGSELSGIRGEALRHSSRMPRSESWKEDAEFREPHRRGEVLVAAMMRSFVRAWRWRMLEGLGKDVSIDVDRVIETAASTADYLLTMVIRALDYAPPIHITFDDYLAALLTADAEVRPNDAPENYRLIVREVFDRFGIRSPTKNPGGVWDREEPGRISYERVHYEPLQSDPNEIFRGVWENRDALHMTPAAYTQIESVRPALRRTTDGFVLKETVAEAVQFLRLTNKELRALCQREASRKKASKADRDRLAVLDEFSPDFTHLLRGGSTLLFDDFGHLKYSIGTRVDNGLAQLGRIESLVDHGVYARPRDTGRQLAELHERRGLESGAFAREQW